MAVGKSFRKPEDQREGGVSETLTSASRNAEAWWSAVRTAWDDAPPMAMWQSLPPGRVPLSQQTNERREYAVACDQF